MKVGCIVEGHGEEQAVPLLLRRIAAHLDPPQPVTIPVTLRVQRDRLKKPGEIERAVELAARKLGGPGAILVLIDADDDLPCRLGPELLARARAQRADLAVAVVVAQREFEAWFLAAAESLAGHRDLPPDVRAPAQPEAVRGAKEWLRHRMGRRYSETLDQAAFTAVFDLDAARRGAASFDKCYRDVARLLQGAQQAAAGG